MIDINSKKFYSIGEAAEYLGVHVQTLRNWDRQGKFKPDSISPGGTRRYSAKSLIAINSNKDFVAPIVPLNNELLTIAYARVSSHDQKEDLVRQVNALELYCNNHGFTFELIQDLGSGMNYDKKGLKKLIRMILDGKVGRLVITHKDRLLRFGAELIFSICEAKNVEVVIINKGEQVSSFEEDLAKDVLEIITVFSARLYGSRSKKNKNLIDKLKNAVEE